MHTFTLVIGAITFKLSYVEILPFLRTERRVKIDEDIQFEDVLKFIKSYPAATLLEFLRVRLGEDTDEASRQPLKKPHVYTYVREYKSVEEYEERLKGTEPNYRAIKTDERGDPAEIFKLTKERIEWELAKKHYCYNYGTVEKARAALKWIIDRHQHKSSTSAETPRSSNDAQGYGTSTLRDSGISTANSPEGTQFGGNKPISSETSDSQSADSNRTNELQNPKNLRIAEAEINHEEAEVSEEEEEEAEVSEEEEEEEDDDMVRIYFEKLKLPFFSGKWNEDLTDHFRRLETEGKAYGWDEADMKRVLAFFLAGAARDWYDRREAELEPKTLNEIKEEFKKRFESKSNQSPYATLSARKQKWSERPMDYFDAMAHLRKKIPNNFTDHDFIAHVLNGLLPEPQKMARQNNPETIEDLEKEIRNIEEALKLVGNPPDPRGPDEASSSANHSELTNRLDRLERLLTAQVTLTAQAPPEHEHPDNPIDQLVAAISKLAGQPNQGGCFRCGDKFHRIADCPIKENTRICYNCSNVGHFARDCVMPPRQSRGSSPSRRRDRSQDRSNERVTTPPTCQLCNAVGHGALQCFKLNDYARQQKN